MRRIISYITFRDHTKSLYFSDKKKIFRTQSLYLSGILILGFGLFFNMDASGAKRIDDYDYKSYEEYARSLNNNQKANLKNQNSKNNQTYFPVEVPTIDQAYIDRSNIDNTQDNAKTEIFKSYKQDISSEDQEFLNQLSNRSTLNEEKSIKDIKDIKDNFYCIEGDCHDSSYEANQELQNAFAGLGVLDEMVNSKNESQITSNDNDQTFQSKVSLFKGDAYSCKKRNGNNCCKSGGISNDLNLDKCSQREKELFTKRANQQCKFVGKTNATHIFCCFDSKFARVMQEQGRSQLGFDFGNSKAANCRGLTKTEIIRLDLERMNLDELVEGILKQAKSGSLENMSKEGLKKRLELKLKNMMRK